MSEHEHITRSVDDLDLDLDHKHGDHDHHHDDHRGDAAADRLTTRLRTARLRGAPLA